MSKKPVPSKKQARTSTRSRWAAYVRRKRQQIVDGLALVPSEGAEGKMRLSHHVCPHTGQYKGRQVLKQKSTGEVIQEIEA